jgi:hypothetical protein
LLRRSGAADVLQACRCVDSGGRFVADLSRTPRAGTVYGVDWADVPEREYAAGAPGEYTRLPGTAALWWADAGVYIAVPDTGEDGPVRGDGQARRGGPVQHDGHVVWFYRPGHRTLTVTTASPATG